MNTLTASRPNSLLASQLNYILVDGSGSMQSKWYENMAAMDEYLTGLKRANINSHVRVVTFATEDHALEERNCRLADCKPFSDEPLRAYFSGTPLYDAINTMCRSLRDLDPPRATILIVTDGGENGSQYTNLDQAKALLNWCRAKGWQVIFMGCDFNNSEQAKRLGANEDTAIGVSKHLLTDAAAMLARKSAAYGLAGTEIHFSKDEQQQFGGLLPKPNGA